MGFRIRYMIVTQGKEIRAYLESVDRLAVLRPVVVDIEGYEAEDSEVEEDFPAWHDAAVVVEPFTPAHFQSVLVKLEVCGAHKLLQYLLEPGVFVSIGQLVGEEHTDVECPRSSNNILSRQLRGNAVVQVKDGNDLEYRETMQRTEERERKAEVEGDTLLQSGFAASRGLGFAIDEAGLDLCWQRTDFLIGTT